MSSQFQKFTSNLQQPKQSKQQAIQYQLLVIYQQRLKSMISVTKIYQQTLQKDNQQGALAFMKTQDMKNYRVQRQLELLKDALLIEKQKIIIQILTTYHQLKNDHQALLIKHKNLEKSFQNNKFLQNQNTPQKEQKQIKPSNLPINSNQVKTNTSISLYEKMLQQKMILLKQLQKKNKLLKTQNEQKSVKISALQQKLKDSLNNYQKERQCQSCFQYEAKLNRIQKLNSDLKAENQETRKSLNEQDQNQNMIENLKKELQAAKQKQQEKENQFYKASPQSNGQTIKQLKEKLFLQQQQLMTLTNSFQFLKQDLNQSLLSQVKRLRSSHRILQDKIKTTINNMKSEMSNFVNEIVEKFQIKSQTKKNNHQILKNLRKIDNQLDFFIEQNNIRG